MNGNMAAIKEGMRKLNAGFCMKIPFSTKFWAGLKRAKEEMDYFYLKISKNGEQSKKFNIIKRNISRSKIPNINLQLQP